MGTIKKGVFIFLVGVFLSGCSIPSENTLSDSTKVDSVLHKPIESKKKIKKVLEPQNQIDFIKIHNDYEEGFSLTTNPIKHSKIFKGRGTELYNLLMKDSMKVNNWIGVVRHIGEDVDGNFTLELKMNNGKIRVSTVRSINNELGIQTQIKKNTPLFQSLGELEEGDTLMFSGRFFLAKRITKSLKPVNIIKEHEALFFEDPIETKIKESHYVFEFYSFTKDFSDHNQ